MKGLMSIAQMRAALRNTGRGDFLPASLHEIVHVIGGYNKVYNHYYSTKAYEFIFQDDNFRKLQEIDAKKREPRKVYTQKTERQSEDDIPIPMGYYMGMSKASQECLDKDETDYARWNMFHRNESVFNKVKNTSSSEIEKTADDTIWKIDYKKESVKLMQKYMPKNPIINCVGLKEIKVPVFREFESPHTPHRLEFLEMYDNDIILDWDGTWQSSIEDGYVEPSEIYSFIVRFFIAKGKIDVSKLKF